MANPFQKSLDNSERPYDWKQARVTPVKKGNLYLAGNHRKIMEHILTIQLTKYFEANDKLSRRQHGFRSQRSWESQLTELTYDLPKKLDEGREIDAVFLDFSKAFDRVDHAKLIHKLQLIGANEQVSNWI